jgi:hypothetical protein
MSAPSHLVRSFFEYCASQNTVITWVMMALSTVGGEAGNVSNDAAAPSDGPCLTLLAIFRITERRRSKIPTLPRPPQSVESRGLTSARVVVWL